MIVFVVRHGDDWAVKKGGANRASSYRALVRHALDSFDISAVGSALAGGRFPRSPNRARSLWISLRLFREGGSGLPALLRPVMEAVVILG